MYGSYRKEVVNMIKNFGKIFTDITSKLFGFAEKYIKYQIFQTR